ncbi:hypothetical protein [Agromyces laixinhei]|uniref:hypothetical protein n=1 Tax=Agromyces laixinhei TaxID=2585717 RepID=UPI001117092A|nr:hypothetical protein [Agromyces laixinhei]
MDRVAFLVVQSALARAPKHETDSTGTDYLLRQILDGPLDIWDELKPVSHALAATKQSTKAVGYLMAMAATGDDPATWKTGERVVESSAQSPAAAELREGAWQAANEGKPLVGWTDEFVATVERALVRATQRGSSAADIRDLAAALVSEPQNRATEALQHGGVDVAATFGHIEALPAVSEGIRTPSLQALEHSGALTGPTKKRGLFARISGSGETTIGAVVAAEAVRQAVRAGSPVVDAEDVSAALASMQEQVTQAGRAWADGTVPLHAAPPIPRATVLLPATWPTVEQELPRRIASLNSLSEVSAVLTG